MARSLKDRVANLEENLHRIQNVPVILVKEEETREQAIERHFQEHPEDRGRFFVIFDPPKGRKPKN